MEQHRGVPSRMPSSDHQFTIRRANKEGATKIILRERFRDRRPIDRKADELFLWALWNHFGEEPFVRGNLDAGRLSWLFGREVVAAEEPFDPQDYDALLRIDLAKAKANFPQIFDDRAASPFEGDDDWD